MSNPVKSLGQTAANQIDTENFFPPTNWLKAEDSVNSPLVALKANSKRNTEYGPKCYLHVAFEGDEAATEWVISFTNKSPAYAQIYAILSEDNLAAGTAFQPGDDLVSPVEGSNAPSSFPFAFRVGRVGKSFRLEDRPAPSVRRPAPRQQPPSPQAPRQPGVNQAPSYQDEPGPDDIPF